MTKYILIAFSFFSLSGCKGEMEFKKVESSSKNKAPEYDEVFLVANTPNDKTLRDSLLVEFAKKICLIFVAWTLVSILIPFSFMKALGVPEVSIKGT